MNRLESRTVVQANQFLTHYLQQHPLVVQSLMQVAGGQVAVIQEQRRLILALFLREGAFVNDQVQ